MLEAAVVIVFPLLCAYAAVTDFLTMTIANRVSVILIVAYLVLAPFIGLGLATIGMDLAGAAIVFALGFGCFAMGWMGGGDVKFATAIALWLGWQHLLEFAVLFSVFGGLLTILTVLVSRWTEPLPILRVGFLADFQRHRTVPYGIALAAAALAVYPSTVWIKILV